MSTDSDVDVVEEYQSFPSYDRQKMEERKREERRGWMITWTGVVVILLVTALVTIALSANDEPADFAADPARSFRMVMTFELTVPDQEPLVLRSEGFIEESNGLARMRMSFPNPSSGKDLEFEFIADGAEIESADIYISINDAFPRPAAAPDDAEWILVDATDPLFESALERQGIGGSNGKDVHPFDFLENLGAEVETKELRTEQLRGVETTVTRVSVDTEDYFAAIGQDEGAAFAASAIGDTMTFDAWLDEDGTLHRMVFAAEVQGAKIKVTMDIFPGEAGEISVPDSSLVFDSRGTPISRPSPGASHSDYSLEEQATSTPTAQPSPSAAPDAQSSGASTTFECTGQSIGGSGEEQTSDC